MGLQTWLIRDRFAPKKWRPQYAGDASSPVTPVEEAKNEGQSTEIGKVDDDAEHNEDGQDAKAEVDSATNDKKQSEDVNGDKVPGDDKKKKKKKQKTQELSTKMLADVVESLIGAAYEHGGFELAIECAQLFHLGIDNWENIPTCIEKSLSHVEPLHDVPPELDLVENMLGYRFSKRTLLVEALTHATYTGDIETQSYERLEFLGDAVLDMIVTDFLYHAPGKNYTPGHMHIRKEALVNSHLLAFICMNTHIDVDASMPAWNAQDGIVINKDTQRIPLCRCLLHSSPRVLDDVNVTYSRWEKNGIGIHQALENDFIYPWAALTSLQAPKFISDMLESILGAIYLDSNGDLGVVRTVLRRLGIIHIMERIVADEVDVLHPVSRLGIWAAKHEMKWEIKSERLEGDISCYVKIDGVEEFRATEPFRGRASQNEVRFAAAEGAIRKLHVIDQEEAEDVDEVEPELLGWD